MPDDKLVPKSDCDTSEKNEEGECQGKCRECIEDDDSIKGYYVDRDEKTCQCHKGSNEDKVKATRDEKKRFKVCFMEKAN